MASLSTHSSSSSLPHKKPKLSHQDLAPASPSPTSFTVPTSPFNINSPPTASCTMTATPLHLVRSDQHHWDLRRLLTHATAFPNETSAVALGEFDPDAGDETLSFLQQECRVLIIGAGGLGCELLKDVVLSGFTTVDIIDMDTIDVSNLNRQFLFRATDVGKSKAECAAAFVRNRVVCCKTDASVTITPHFKKVQDMDADFYRQFHVILSGLDNIEARRYLNSLVVSLAEVDENGEVDPATIIPLIDGGTEGLRGQARVIIPRITSCFECSLETFPPQKSFPMCTIAETPRQPAHCIAYAFIVLWPREFPKKKLDKDSPVHMQWVYQAAKDRAEQFGIAGVTYSLTLGVVKNIIPAVASTNAVVAAICASEALKAMSYCSRLMNNYHMHMGATGCYSHTFQYDRKKDCVVCSSQQRTLHVDADSMTMQNLIDHLCGDNFRLSKPSISSGSANLFMQGPPYLRAATSPNLDKTLRKLVKDGESLTVTDAVFVGDMALSLQIVFQSTKEVRASLMED